MYVSVKDLVPGRFVEVLDVRNLQGPDRLDGRCQNGLGLTGTAAARQVPSGLSQRSKDLRPIESLTRTVLTKTHCRSRFVCRCGSLILAASALRATDPGPCHTFRPRLSFV